MKKQCVSLLFVFVIAAGVPVHAQITGTMDAVMARGVTQTFTVSLNFTIQTFAQNTALTATISADSPLTLGHTTLQGFACTETPNVNTCRGNAAGSGSQTIVVTQVVS
ncbi:MAG TPA: hypothetical protein VII32_09025, partial [Thermoanaerobaculia bacterium]